MLDAEIKLNMDIPKITRTVRKHFADALLIAVEHLLESANRVVPHDQGNLQNSGKSNIDESQLEASVSYDTPYAVRLHEHPEYKFRNNRIGKWLEITYKDNAKKIGEWVANYMKARLR
jgi:hypothetical protein